LQAAGEQLADDRLDSVELGRGGVDQPGAQVVAEAEASVKLEALSWP
jgi:hypothetical protein